MNIYHDFKNISFEKIAKQIAEVAEKIAIENNWMVSIAGGK